MSIDPATLAELNALDDSGGLLSELVDLFASGTPDRIARLRAAVMVADADAVVREAHALKGSCGTLGAVELLALATQMELRAKASDLSSATAQLELIETAFGSALLELQALVMRG